MVSAKEINYGHTVEYDLHIHSNVSDGTLTPYQVIDLAASINLKGISITDHDDMAFDHIAEYAKKKNLQFIYGLEFSTSIPNLHILGYNLDWHSIILKEYIEDQKSKREKAIKEMCKKAYQMGMDISFDDIENSSNQSLGRPHLASVMVKKGYVKNIYEAFHKYLKNNKPIFVDYKKFSYLKILEIILKCNGLAVLAHPGMLKYSTFKSILYNSIKNGLMGIEVYYPRHTISQINKFKRIAREYNLIICGGSDFHGSIKPDIKIGSTGINQEEFDCFLQAIDY